MRLDQRILHEVGRVIRTAGDQRGVPHQRIPALGDEVGDDVLQRGSRSFATRPILAGVTAKVLTPSKTHGVRRTLGQASTTALRRASCGPSSFWIDLVIGRSQDAEEAADENVGLQARTRSAPSGASV